MKNNYFIFGILAIAGIIICVPVVKLVYAQIFPKSPENNNGNVASEQNHRQTQTGSLSIYTNSTHGFKINYPANWQIQPFGAGDVPYTYQTPILKLASDGA